MRRRVLISTDQLDNYHEIGVTAAITYQPKQNRDALNSGHKFASSLLSTTAQAQKCLARPTTGSDQETVLEPQGTCCTSQFHWTTGTSHPICWWGLSHKCFDLFHKTYQCPETCSNI